MMDPMDASEMTPKNHVKLMLPMGLLPPEKNAEWFFTEIQEMGLQHVKEVEHGGQYTEFCSCSETTN